MNKPLKVLVQGTGFAGMGHAAAFRAAGTEIVGMVGRTDHVVRDVAKQLNIPFMGTDWQAALSTCQPDIVSIATPGGAHYDPIKQAISQGCHVFCDKPMTATGSSAQELFELAQAKPVKTAFAASHFNLEREIPFGWSHRAEDGGGRLNNNFTHTLSIVTAVIGDRITRIAGDVRDDLGRAPIVDGVHNFTTRRDLPCPCPLTLLPQSPM